MKHACHDYRFEYAGIRIRDIANALAFILLLGNG